MLRSKKTEHAFFVITQFYGGVSERTGDHFSFVTEVELGEPYRDLGFFPGDRRDQFDFMSGSLLMVLITSVSGVGQHLFGCKPHFFSSLDGRDQSLGVMMVRRFNVNMSDQGKCRGLILGAVGFGDLNLVALPLVAIIGRIRVGKDFAASPRELPGWA